MTDEIFELFKNNFSDITRTEEIVKNILSDKENHIISYRCNGKLSAVSIINGNTVYLFCVDKAFQKQGVGTRLLLETEEYIVSKGYNKIIMGVGKKYIMPGIPMNNGAHYFFIKHGYKHSWNDCGCFDMSQLLIDFGYNEHIIGDIINGITYRWATINDLDNIVKCVSDAEKYFVRYYQDKYLYEKNTKSPVLIAVSDDKVLGTILVGIETEGKGIGSVGCTTTMHKYRNKGIATNLVKLGTKHLKDLGLKKAFLGYTYTYIINMYSRAGYKVCMEYFMGEKEI
jgi:GNAT superfamily N-acetyltransferase